MRRHPEVGRRKAVLYARVSSKEQEKDGFSIPAQLRLLRNYGVGQSIDVLKEFVDVETARQSGRAGFGEMHSFLQQNPTIRIVLVEKTDRLYRNLKDWVSLDELELEIHFVKEGVIISPDSRSTEKFMHGIKVLMAKNYIDNLSEEVKKGMREKAEQGHWPTVAPIGYVNNPETHRIEPDPDYSGLVAKVFEWYATGHFSLNDVTRMAADTGLRKRRSGKRLNKAEIHRVLRNRIYYGLFVWNGRTFEGKHIPLISANLFMKVQDVFDKSNRPKQTKRQFPFTGLLTCGLCKNSITAEIKKGKYVYYHCTQFHGKCGNTYIREEKLSDLLGNLARGIQINEEIANEIGAALRESHDDKRRFHRDTIKETPRPL